MAGASLEKTAQEMPQPNIQVLEAKGYSPAQIQNVLRGYAEVQKSLYEDVQKTGEEGVSTAAEGIANAAFFGFGGDKIRATATRLMGGNALAGGAGAAVKAVAGGAATHAVTGVAFGGGYGAVHGATERMAKAKAAGLGANDMFTAGMQGAWEEGVPSAVIGGIIGGAIGVPAAMFSTAAGMNKTASAMRKAIADAHVEDAQRVHLQKFADDFRPAELPQRFAEDLAAAGGDDVALANNIVGGVWGSDVAATEAGQRAASKMYEKIRAWRTLRDRMNGPMIELPATAVETPGASITPTLTPEQQAMGLQPNTLPAGVPPQVAPMQGLEPVGAGAPVQGGMAPQPNVVGEFKPTPEMQPTAAPQGVKPVQGLQPVGAAVPAPASPPLVLQGNQPLGAEGAPAPRLGPNLGPVEQGGRPAPPAPEINPKLQEKIVKAVVTVDGEPFQGRTHAEALEKAMRAGVLTPEMILNEKAGAGKVNADLFLTEKGRLITRQEAEAMQGASDSVDLGLTKEPAAKSVAEPHKGTNPNDNVRAVVNEYNKGARLPEAAHGEYHPLNQEMGAKIARAYEELPKTPATPEAEAATKKAYGALNAEIAAQKKSIEAAGYKLEFSDTDPYKNSAEMLADVRDNHRLKVLKASEGHHPFMTDQETNDFRAVHDFFGHATEGYQFGARGEDNAFRAHAQMFSNDAIPALATETRGQNSWVNFNPGHEKMSATERPFAEQKAGLLPPWTYKEVLHPGAAEPHPVNMPTHVESAVAALGQHEHVMLAADATGESLKIEKLGVTAGTLAKPGASSDALAHVNAIADEQGLRVESRITEQAGPRGGKIPLEKLLPWYEQHGYKVVRKGEGWAEVRREPSAGAIADRVKGLSAAEAKLAAGNVQLGQPLAHADFGTRLGKVLDSAADAARARIKARGTRLSMGLDPADLADHSIVLAAEMFSHGMRTKAAVAAWLTEKYGVAIKPHIEAIYAKAQKRLMVMFKSDARAQTKLKELVGLRGAGAHGMGWYEETATWVKKTFGPEDSDMFLRFLALTSADSSTEGGAALAMKAFAQWKGGLPFDGMRGPHMVGMLHDAVRGENFGGDKIQSFYRALRGEKDAVVLDRWMIRALGLPASRSALSEPDYKLYSAIVRNLADDAKMSPRQLQAAIWEGSRVGDLHKRWKSGGPSATSKVGPARPLEHLLQREFGGMTPYQWVEQNHMKHQTLADMSAGLRAARETGGYTFNPQDWKTDASPGYVVTLATDMVPRQEFYPAALTKFANHFKHVISTSAFGGPHVNIGVFDLKDYKPGHYSLDFNVVIPQGPGALEKAKAIGKQTRQFEIGEVGPDGQYVQGHKTGYNPKKDGAQYLPPVKGSERTAWFKSAVARARTLIDQVEFTMKPKER
jgi:hypothetical protein